MGPQTWGRRKEASGITTQMVSGLGLLTDVRPAWGGGRSVRPPWRRKGVQGEARLVGAGRSKVRVKPFKTFFAVFFLAGGRNPSGFESFTDLVAPGGTVDVIRPLIQRFHERMEAMEPPLKD